MKTIIKIIFINLILIILVACSSTWHLKRAIKKDHSIIVNKIDTINVIVPGESKVIYSKDSIEIFEPRIYIKAISKDDSLVLIYKISPDTIRIIETKTVFNIPKTRQDKRLESKSERLNIRLDNKKERLIIRRDNQKEKLVIRRKSPKGISKFSMFLLGCVTGVLFSFLILIIIYRKNRFL